MTSTTVSEAIDEIGTAIPFIASRGIGDIDTGAEVQGAPDTKERTLVVGKAQPVRPICQDHRRHATQI